MFRLFLFTGMLFSCGTVLTQELTINPYVISDFPLFKSSTVKGFATPGVGFSLGYTPDSTQEAYGIGPNVLLYGEYGFPTEEVAKIPMDNNSGFTFHDYGTVNTSFFRSGINLGFGFNTKKNHRKIAPCLGFYFYKYFLDYTYTGPFTIAPNLNVTGPGQYEFKTGSVGLTLNIYKYYFTKKVTFFWCFGVLFQSMEYSERTENNTHLDTMPLYAFNLKTGIILNPKPIIEKLSKY